MSVKRLHFFLESNVNCWFDPRVPSWLYDYWHCSNPYFIKLERFMLELLTYGALGMQPWSLLSPVAQKWSDARAVANTALPSCKWALINQSPGGMISATVTTGEKFCHSTVTYILGESRKRDVFSPHFQSKKAFYNYMWRPTLIRNKCNESGAVVDLFHSRAWLCRILCRMWSERRLALRRILSP